MTLCRDGFPPQDYYAWFGESDSEEEDNFEGFTEEEIQRSQADSDTAYMETLTDVMGDIDEEREVRDNPVENQSDETPCESKKESRNEMQKQQENLTEKLPVKAHEKKKAFLKKRRGNASDPHPVLAKRRCSDRHGDPVKVEAGEVASLKARTESSKKPRKGKGVEGKIDPSTAPTPVRLRFAKGGEAEGTNFKSPNTASRTKRPSRSQSSTSKLLEETPNSSGDDAPDATLIETSISAPDLTSMKPDKLSQTVPIANPALIVCGKRERKPSMKIKMIAADNPTDPSTPAFVKDKIKELVRPEEVSSSPHTTPKAKKTRGIPLEEEEEEDRSPGRAKDADSAWIDKQAKGKVIETSPDEKIIKEEAIETISVEKTAKERESETLASQSESSPIPGQLDTSTKLRKDQVKYLKETFEVNAYPNLSERKQMAAALDMQPVQVRYWFERTRKKLKKKFPDRVFAGTPGTHRPDAETLSHPGFISLDSEDDDAHELKIDLDATTDSDDNSQASKHDNVSTFLPHLDSPTSASPSQNRKKGEHYPKEVLRLLWSCLIQHNENPYPSMEEKQKLVLSTGLNMYQVTTCSRPPEIDVTST
jgi:hypothetical protein